MAARLDPLVRFGTFKLDLRTGKLRKGGVRVNLPEQPLQVLKTLLDRPGELVTREEVRQRLWSAETFVDFEHGLNASVRRLRDALGDSAETPRFVETLPRRGYRFIAPVTHEPAANSPPSVPEIGSEARAVLPPEVKPAWRPTRVSIAGVIGAVAVVTAAVLWVSGYRLGSAVPHPSTADTGRLMLAVLPFENLTGDPDNEYISDGMTEELIAQLGRMDPSRLGVIARTSAMQFKKTSKRADEISVDLGVSHLLEGSIRTTGSRIRIAVQLIETQHESHVWAELYERDAKDVVTLQRDVAEAIVRQVTTSLAVASSDSIASRRHSTSAEAYQNYLRGRYYWSKDTADRLQKAMEHFHRAIELDPSYALAYSGVADTYILLGSDGFLPMSEAYPLARTAALKALELDDKVGEAHMSMAAVSADYDWDWPEADRHYKRAVALNPNDVTAQRSYTN
jgi:TolB-like protein/DNA-binding winged helix-turn-helix (wHTH) protein